MRAATPSFARHLARGLVRRVAAVLPSSCALCGCRADDAMCDACRARYCQTPCHRCVQCGHALPFGTPSADARCGACLRDPPAFDATFVATDYAPPVNQLILALKFGGQLPLAAAFADLMCEAWRRATPDASPTLLAPVPLGAARLTARGFNQAQEIARALAPLLDVPLHSRLALRVRDTVEQATLPPGDRRKNIRRAFTVSPDAIERVRGAHVGIVDDVMTTGETLNELAATLKRFGAVRVSNFVFARSSS